MSHWVRRALHYRPSPESTRRATLFERLTVRRFEWRHILFFNRYLELAGKVATGLWCGFLASLVVGVDWKQVVEAAVNSGRPVQGALVVAIAAATAVFITLRSLIGFARWRLQRELWRRDVEGTTYPRAPSSSVAEPASSSGRRER